MNTKEFQHFTSARYEHIKGYGWRQVNNDAKYYAKCCKENKEWAIKEYGEGNIKFDPFCGFIPKNK